MFASEDPFYRDTQADLLRSLEQRGVMVEQLSPHDRSSVALLELYGVDQLPAMVITSDDGGLVTSWQTILPTASEAAYLAHGV